jgi:hypothetical protein
MDCLIDDDARRKNSGGIWRRKLRGLNLTDIPATMENL